MISLPGAMVVRSCYHPRTTMISSSVFGVEGRISSWQLFPFLPLPTALGIIPFFPSRTRTRLGLFPLFPSSNSDPSPPTSLGCRVSPPLSSWSPFAAARPKIFGTGPALVQITTSRRLRLLSRVQYQKRRIGGELHEVEGKDLW